MLKGLIHRAHVICDLKEDLLEELDLLKNVFVRNGYPEQLVTKTLKESWPRETLKMWRLKMVKNILRFSMPLKLKVLLKACRGG